MGRASANYLSTKGFIVYAATRDVENFKDIENKNIIPIELDLRNQKSIKKAVELISGLFKHCTLIT